MNKWITDRKPESGREVLVTLRGRTKNHVMHSYIRQASWYKGTSSVADIEMVTAFEYNEKTDEFYIPEGWYVHCEECDHYWLIHDPVWGWMPLPEPMESDVEKEL